MPILLLSRNVRREFLLPSCWSPSQCTQGPGFSVPSSENWLLLSCLCTQQVVKLSVSVRDTHRQTYTHTSPHTYISNLYIYKLNIYINWILKRLYTVGLKHLATDGR